MPLRACTPGALQGCKALLAHQDRHGGERLSIDAIVRLETKLFREVPIATLSQEDRRGSLSLLLDIVKVSYLTLIRRVVRHCTLQ